MVIWNSRTVVSTNPSCLFPIVEKPEGPPKGEAERGVAAAAEGGAAAATEEGAAAAAAAEKGAAAAGGAVRVGPWDQSVRIKV